MIISGMNDQTPILSPPPAPPLLPLLPELPDPPVLSDDSEDGDGDQDGVFVQVSVTVFGVHRGVQLFFPELPADDKLARELYGAAAAVAAMQGSGVLFELQRRCLDSSGGAG